MNAFQCRKTFGETHPPQIWFSVCILDVPVEGATVSWPAGPENEAASPAAVIYFAAQPVEYVC